MEVSSQPIKAFPAHSIETQGAAEDSVDALSRAPPKNATALARTRSQIIRDTAFGTDQDDLSDISDYDSPAPRSKVVRRSTSASTITVVRGRLSFEPTSVRSTARITRGRVGEVVLDSDDDAPPVAPPQQVRPRKKTLVREPTVDDDATSYPPSLPFVPLVSAASAVIPLPAPATPLSQTGCDRAGDSSNLGLRSGTDKVLRFSEIPAPDFNAALSSPIIAPKSVLKGALVNKSSRSRPVDDENLLDSSPPRAPPAVGKSRTLRSAAAKANDILQDLG